MNSKELLEIYEDARDDLTNKYREMFHDMEEEFSLKLQKLRDEFLADLELLTTNGGKELPKPLVIKEELPREEPKERREPAQKVVAKRGANSSWNIKR